MKRLHYTFLFLGVITLAVALRLPQLDRRPMHGDEAVHAVKFGALLEDGYYRYDPYQYHGPALNYLTLIPAWVGNIHTFGEVNEFTLRIVPVFGGILLILFLYPLIEVLGWPLPIMAALLTACSPAMVFYSRYYIQEMLLVCFNMGAIVAGVCYIKRQNYPRAIMTGLFLGLMQATKETWIIFFIAMLASLLMVLRIQRKKGQTDLMLLKVLKNRHLIAAILTAVFVSMLFYSSFFTSPKGILDSILTYRTYFDRAGQNEWHIHPWYFYLERLLWFKFSGGPLWSEGIIAILAATGLVMVVMKRNSGGIYHGLGAFFAFYTIFLIIIFALIPYKTPWNLLGFLHGMIILGGFGGIEILKSLKEKFVRITIGLLISAGIIHLLWQAYRANFVYYADPLNPYVYAHPGEDVIKVSKRVAEIALSHPEGNDMYIQVIFPGDDYWPLPWYLRKFPNTGWWNHVDESVPAAPVIIVSPDLEAALVRKLYELPPPGERHLYVALFESYRELRPNVEMRGYVIQELWNNWRR